MYQTSSRVVNDVQRRVGSFIKAQNEDKVVVLPLWIQNTLVVRYNEDNCTLKSFFDRALQGFPGVLTVEEDTQVLRLMRAQQEGGAAHTEGGEAEECQATACPRVVGKRSKGEGGRRGQY